MKGIWEKANKEFKTEFLTWYNNKQFDKLYEFKTFIGMPLVVTQGVINAYLAFKGLVVLHTEHEVLIMPSATKMTRDVDPAMWRVFNKGKLTANYKLAILHVVENYPKSVTPF